MNLSDIFDRLGDRHPAFEGNGWVVICPAHNDTKPSLRVAVSDDDRLLLKCRAGCKVEEVLGAIGASGFHELEPVVMDVEETAKRVNDDGSPVDPSVQARMASYLFAANHELLQHEDALEYAHRRFGLTEAQCQELELGYDDGSHDYELLGPMYRRVPRLVVPFYNMEGKPHGFQSRALEETKVRWAGPSNPDSGGTFGRYAFFEANSGMDYVVITEGPGDALTAYGAGFDTIGIRGASLGGDTASELAPHLENRRVILAGDNDAAGRGFNEAIAASLSRLGVQCATLELPPGVPDVSAWHEASPDTFVAAFQKAVSDAPFIQSIASATEIDDRLIKTDYGLALYIREFIDEDILYTPELGFLIWDGRRWVEDTADHVRNLAHEAADHLRNTGATENQSGAAMRLYNRYTLDQVLKELQSIVAADFDTFDVQHGLLNVRNGTVDLETGELQIHNRGDRLTHLVDVDYHLEAEAPRWESFLGEVFPDNPDLVEYARRLIGYGITGLTSEQCFAVLWGRGANGKSVFTDTLSYVFEGITTTTPFSTFEDSFGGGIPNDLAALRGARLVMASEGEQGKPMAEAVLKRITGQDLISARFLRKEFFEFRPTFLILLATNFKPNFRGQDEGLWRRVKLMPWRRYFEPAERDYGLTAELRKEAEGILRWAVRGSVEWFAAGLQDPTTISSATESYRETSDNLSGFFPGIYERGTDEDSAVLSDIYKDYVEYCDDEELSMKERWSRRALAASLEERGLEKRRRNNGMVFLGLKRTLQPSHTHRGSDTPNLFEAST